MKYFMSDPHFGHASILTFERTCFASIADHDREIMNSFKRLTINDILYVLGDIGTMTDELKEEWLAIPAYKILIKGNHDNKPKGFYAELFDEINDTPIYLTSRILLSHQPIKVDDDILNVHGHLHGSYILLPNYMNVSYAVINYKLITEKDIMNKLGTIKKDRRKYDFLNEWWANDQVIIEGTNGDRVDLVLRENRTIDVEKSKELHKKLDK